MFISVVIPLYNEEASIHELYQRLTNTLQKLTASYLLIFIDDGSQDNSLAVIERLYRQDNHVVGVSLRRNFGKSAALATGFGLAEGDVVITIDSDLQDQPEEIPRFLEKFNEGYDLISGWKKNRNDPFFRVIASRVFNFLSSLVSGFRLHDINCGFKAYRISVIREIDIYGELHRFLPIFAARRGFRVGEITVEHQKRIYGHSKFGPIRYVHGFIDLLTVFFLTRYIERPAHFFGGWGIVSLLTGLGISFYLSILWFLGVRPIGNRPLFFFGILLIIVSLQLLSLGILGEVLVNKNVKTSYPMKKLLWKDKK